jgi:dTDP-4-amino-4,6-dideoxygalactose transaminase
VPLSDVRLPREAVDAASEVLRSGWLSSGPRVERFEADLARYVGTPHAVACSSGTAALQLAVTALGIGAGDEVVMPSLTFVAAANAVRLVGARPVFADVKGEDDLTLDPDAAEAAIGPRTRAILPVHYGGWPCDPALRELADSHRLALVEDAAHALGAEAGPGRCGSWGDAGCFSFFANKNLPLGEGGMLATNEPAVAETARRLRSHGMTSGTWERQAAAPMAYDVTMPGFNARLDEVRAAMGSALLPLLDEMNAARAGAAERYRARLAEIPDLGVPFSGRGPQETSAHHLFVVLLSPGVARDEVVAHLTRRGLQTSVHYRPVHQLSAYAGGPARLDRTEAVAQRLLTLPLFPQISPEQVDLVCDALAEALASA